MSAEPPDAGTAAVLGAVEAAFDVARPAWFCDARHCCECAEHEAELQPFTRETLPLEVVQSPAWDPICFIRNPDGFAYFLPRLARFAYGRGERYYLDLFLSNLREDRIARFTDAQRAALIALIHDVVETLGPDVASFDWPELEWTLRRLE